MSPADDGGTVHGVIVVLTAQEDGTHNLQSLGASGLPRSPSSGIGFLVSPPTGAVGLPSAPTDGGGSRHIVIHAGVRTVRRYYAVVAEGALPTIIHAVTTTRPSRPTSSPSVYSAGAAYRPNWGRARLCARAMPKSRSKFNAS